MVAWIYETLNALSNMGIKIGDSKTDSKRIKTLLDINKISETSDKAIRKYSIPMDSDKSCKNQINMRCDLSNIIESNKGIAVEFRTERSRMMGGVSHFVDVATIKESNTTSDKKKEYSCKSCFYKYRLDTLLDRMEYASLKFKTDFRQLENPKEYSLLGIKHQTKDGKINSIVVLGLIDDSNQKYLICKDSILLRINDKMEILQEEAADGIIENKSYKIVYFNVERLKKLDFSGEKNIFEEDYDKFILEWKNVFTDDEIFPKIRNFIPMKEREKEIKVEKVKDKERMPRIVKIFVAIFIPSSILFFIWRVTNTDDKKTN